MQRQEDIKRAYFEAAQKLHPDKNTAAGETEFFLDVQHAYEVLCPIPSDARSMTLYFPRKKR